jgi:DNA-binding LacI/PurR family transcriptional regulator
MTSVNQQYIAEQLNISRTTVSRCFTNHPGINPVTRAKVFRLASQLGYQHMEMRVSSKPKRLKSLVVGVLICTNVEEYFRPDYQSPGDGLYSGVSEYAQLHDVKLELHYVDPADCSLGDASYSCIEALRERDWDGVVLIYPFPKSVVDELSVRFPLISLVEQHDAKFGNCVDVDHYMGISSLMNQLVNLGHKQIGFFTKSYEVQAAWSFRRYSSYAEKVARMNWTLNSKNVVNVAPNHFEKLEDSYDYVANRIQSGVTAWVCAADHQAYDLIAALRKRGIDVPKDASITGFDGIQKPKGLPQLTTAMIPYREIGFVGTRRLVELAKKRFSAPQHILVGCQICEGETTGPMAAPSVSKRSRNSVSTMK